MRLLYLFNIVLITLLCSILLVQGCKSDIKSSLSSNKFVGTWIRTEPDSLVLKIVEYNADSFAFSMIDYNPNYYGYLRGDTGSRYKYAAFNDSVAWFNDEGAISDGKPLYRDDEEPCELFFKKTSESTLLIGEKNCYLIYGGAGVTWEGKYNFLDL